MPVAGTEMYRGASAGAPLVHRAFCRAIRESPNLVRVADFALTRAAGLAEFEVGRNSVRIEAVPDLWSDIGQALG